MPSDATPRMPSGDIHTEATDADLRSEYDRLREELTCLMAEPVKDYLRIDELVDQLELTQLAVKEQHGLKGNNPNE